MLKSALHQRFYNLWLVLQVDYGPCHGWMTGCVSAAVGKIAMEDFELTALSTIEYSVFFYKRYTHDILLSAHRDDV